MELTTAQAATRLQLSQDTIKRWCRQGLLSGAHMRYGNRRLGWRIPETTIDGLVRAGRADVLQQVPEELETD